MVLRPPQQEAIYAMKRCRINQLIENCSEVLKCLLNALLLTAYMSSRREVTRSLNFTFCVNVCTRNSHFAISPNPQTEFLRYEAAVCLFNFHESSQSHKIMCYKDRIFNIQVLIKIEKREKKLKKRFRCKQPGKINNGRDVTEFTQNPHFMTLVFIFH